MSRRLSASHQSATSQSRHYILTILVNDATKTEIDQRESHLICLSATSALIVCRLFIELLTINFHSPNESYELMKESSNDKNDLFERERFEALENE